MDETKWQTIEGNRIMLHMTTLCVSKKDQLIVASFLYSLFRKNMSKNCNRLLSCFFREKKKKKLVRPCTFEV